MFFPFEQISESVNFRVLDKACVGESPRPDDYICLLVQKYKLKRKFQDEIKSPFHCHFPFQRGEYNYWRGFGSDG